MQSLWHDPNLPWRRKLAWASLLPAAGLYRVAATGRAAWWRSRAHRARTRVISVGNLTVGGNSKTPFALLVAKRLSERGLAVGIVSRGYRPGRKSPQAALVSLDGKLLLTPEQAGDEPVMMARSFSGPVAIARERIDAIELLLSRGPLDAVILDDGFQHLELWRDVNILLINSARGFGNRWVLPAGPMREPLSAGRRASAIVLIDDSCGETVLRKSDLARMGDVPIFKAALRPAALVRAEPGGWRELPPWLSGQKVLAVSGIANARGFHAMLGQLDAELADTLEYPDHHEYTASDWRRISATARSADMIITTEKDLVKLERLPFAHDSLYALRLEIDAGKDEDALMDLITGGQSAANRAREA